MATSIIRDEPPVDNSVGMAYLNSLPRRLVTVYLPILVFMFVLLFPFYWMGVTALKPNDELTNFRDYSPFWPSSPTLEHIKYLLLQTSYPGWLWNTFLVALGSTAISLVAAVLGAYAVERARSPTSSRSARWWMAPPVSRS
jgi:multiple sugar transport system permease protein